MPSQFVIYGANGYSGSLTARLAVERGLHPILAGRNAGALERMSDRLDLEQRVFRLDEPQAIDRALAEVALVLHCAGPFRDTYRPMVESCLRTHTHYLDITGEIGVYQAVQRLGAGAAERRVMLLPGIGFDVVPTDCLAVHLKHRLPSATHLTLAFRSYGPAGVSRGTARTTVEALGGPSWVRRDGALTPVPHMSRQRTVDFGDGPTQVWRMVWGDIFTAYHSTGIPNIEDYYRIPSQVRLLLPAARLLRPLLAWPPVRGLLRAAVGLLPAGPTEEQRPRSRTAVWGQVHDDRGQTAAARLHGPESYTFTALTALAAIQQVLGGNAPPGYQTPATAYGPDFVLEVEGVRRERLA